MEDSIFIYNYKKNMIKRGLIFLISLCFSFSVLFSGISLFNKNFTSPLTISDSLSYSSENIKDEYIKIDLIDAKSISTADYAGTSNLETKVLDAKNGNYVALGFDNKIIIANLCDSDFEKFNSKSTSSYTLRGIVKNLSEDKLSIIKDNLKDKGFSEAQLNSLVFKNYIEVMSPLQSASQPIIIALIILVISLVLFIHKSIQNSEMLNSLNSFSNVYPDLIYDEIDKELLKKSSYSNGPITVTDNYIVIISDSLVAAIPLSELVWMYKGTDKIYKNKCIFKNRKIYFVLSNRVKCSIKLYDIDDKLEELLNYISKKCPKTILGYSEDIKHAIKKYPKEFFENWSNFKI